MTITRTPQRGVMMYTSTLKKLVSTNTGVVMWHATKYCCAIDTIQTRRSNVVIHTIKWNADIIHQSPSMSVMSCMLVTLDLV